MKSKLLQEEVNENTCNSSDNINKKCDKNASNHFLFSDRVNMFSSQFSQNQIGDKIVVMDTFSTPEVISG